MDLPKTQLYKPLTPIEGLTTVEHTPTRTVSCRQGELSELPHHHQPPEDFDRIGVGICGWGVYHPCSGLLSPIETGDTGGVGSNGPSRAFRVKVRTETGNGETQPPHINQWKDLRTKRLRSVVIKQRNSKTFTIGQ